MNAILCELRNLKYLLSRSPLIITNNIFVWRLKYNCILSSILCSFFIASCCIVYTCTMLSQSSLLAAAL